jgi:hypothetical protein
MEDRSGHDMDVLGGEPVTPLLLPNPQSGVQDCPRKDEDGTCSEGCSACITFSEQMNLLAPSDEMD